jgi:phage-related holin
MDTVRLSAVTTGDNMLEFIKTIHFASLTWILILPLSLMGIDVLTGLFNALWKEKNFKSSVMRSGLTKKVGEIAIILIGILFTYGMTLPLYIMKARDVLLFTPKGVNSVS